jgi:4-amino-4-deoxy-L-arabinose transferase-like glycosyltransferase
LLPTRPSLAIAAIAILAGAVAVPFAWQTGLASLFDDSVSYLVMAQAMDPWSTPSAAILDAFPRQTYPPVFPLAVSLVGGAHDWRIAHVLVASCFAASVFLYGHHARLVTGSSITGIAAALTLAFLPAAWVNLKGVLSEFPYLALSLATLIHYQRLQPSRSPGALSWVVLGLLLAGTLLTRSVGAALLAAVAASEALRWMRCRDNARLGSAAIALAIPVAAASLWYTLRTVAVENIYVGILGGVVRGTLEHGPGSLLGLMGENLSGLGFSWPHEFIIVWQGSTNPGFLLAVALGILALAGTAWRAVRGEADALYAVFFLAILLVYPYPWHMYRLGLPIVPVLLVCGLWALQELCGRTADPTRGRRIASWASFAPLVLCLPATLFYVAPRAATPEEAGSSDYRRSDIAEFYRIPSGPMAASIATRQIEIFRDLDRIRASTPSAARVMWYLPDYVALLAQREGVQLDAKADAAALAEDVRRGRADFIYVTAMRLRDEGAGGAEPMAPARQASMYTSTVWARKAATGNLESVLLKVDKEQLEATARR